MRLKTLELVDTVLLMIVFGIYVFFLLFGVPVLVAMVVYMLADLYWSGIAFVATMVPWFVAICAYLDVVDEIMRLSCAKCGGYAVEGYYRYRMCAESSEVRSYVKKRIGATKMLVYCLVDALLLATPPLIVFLSILLIYDGIDVARRLLASSLGMIVVSVPWYRAYKVFADVHDEVAQEVCRKCAIFVYDKHAWEKCCEMVAKREYDSM